MDIIQMINVGLIETSPLNPRKVVDPNSIMELSESIKSVGLLQPITVRLISQLPLRYELILGSRRLAACKLLNKIEVQAIVKEMTDDEVLEAMIIENLQRKDIEPLDEANAFNELLSKNKTIEDIAATVGKSTFFVRGRLKLIDLIDDFKLLLAEHKLVLSNAYEICKVDKEIQQAIYDQHYADGIDATQDWSKLSLSEIKEKLSKTFYSLLDVDFDKTECNGCKYNTTTASSLFNEYRENNCTNLSCFQSKKQNYIIQMINDCLEREIPIMVVAGREKMITQLKSYGVEHPVLYTPENTDLILYPEKPLLEDYDDEENFKNHMEIYISDIENFDANCIAKGYKKAYSIGMIKKGVKYLYYKVNEPVGVIEPVEQKVPEKVSEAVKETKIQQLEEIDKLEKKDKRNIELKSEKIIEEMKKMLSESDYREKQNPLFDFEKDILLGCILFLCNNPKIKDITAKFNKDLSYIENVANIIPSDRNIISRSYIKQLVVSATVDSNKDIQEMLRAISKNLYEDKYNEIEAKYEEKYQEQKKRIDARISLINGENKKEKKSKSEK